MEERQSSVKMKKGLSAIVATVLIVLITFAAFTIIAGFVFPFVNENLARGSECVDYRDYLVFDSQFDYNCFETSGGGYNYYITVRANSLKNDAEPIPGLKLSFLSESNAAAVDVDHNSSMTSEIRMNSNTAELLVPNDGEVRTYVYNSIEKFNSVEVYAKLNNGRMCEKADSISLEDVC